MKNKTQNFIIQTPMPFSYEESYAFLSRSILEPLHFCKEGKIRKLLEYKEELLLFEIGKKGVQDLEVALLNTPLDSDKQAFIEAYIQEWFDLKKDIAPFYALGAKDAILSGLLERYHGLRIVGMNDLFETLSWAIIGQQINLNFAYTMKKRWVERFGKKLHFENQDYFLHPDYSIVDESIYEDLIGMQFSRQKAKYILETAKAFQEDRLSLDKLKSYSFEEAKKYLCQFKGIGNWTANYVLMKTLKYSEAFPIEDAGLLNALKIQLGHKEKPDKSKVLELAKAWQGWEAYATFYLWRSIT